MPLAFNTIWDNQEMGFLDWWSNEMQTQDNAGTSQPIYFVYELVRGKGKSTNKFFFTRKSAEAYIKNERHNLTNPYIFVDSAHDNQEAKMMVHILLKIVRAGEWHR